MTEERHGEKFRNAHALCERLEKKWRDHQYESKYSPDQPRVPAGNPDGGEWTSGGGGISPSGSDSAGKPSWGTRLWQETFGSTPAAADESIRTPAEKAADIATGNILDPKKHQFGDHLCATYVREDLNRAGIPLKPPLSGAAKDFGPQLTKPDVGFEKVAGTDHAGKDFPPDGYIPQAGDVVIIQGVNAISAGHMAMYASNGYWYSDHQQVQGFWPGSGYRTVKPTYTIYRHRDQ
jgi:hypothetical protein